MNDAEQKARESALRYLSFRPRSIVEVKKFLLKKKYELPLIESVIASLTETRFLDDQQFAQWWAEARIKSGKSGPIRIKQELRLKGISKEMIDTVLQRDWKKIALEAMRKAAGKMTKLDPKKRIQKLQASLARAGFTWDQIQDAVASLK